MKKLLSVLTTLTMAFSLTACSNAGANVSAVTKTQTEAKDEKEDKDIKAAKETIDGYFTSYQEGDIDALQDYGTDSFNEYNEMESVATLFDELKTEADTMGLDENSRKAFDDFIAKACTSAIRKYEITKAEKDSDKIKATVKIEGVDLEEFNNIDTTELENTLTEKYTPLAEAATTEEEINSLMSQMISEFFSEIGKKIDALDSQKQTLRITLVKQDGEWLINSIKSIDEEEKNTETKQETTTEKKGDGKAIATDKSGNLKVTEAGYQITESKYANGVIVVQNDNKKRAYESAEVKVTAYDTDDKVLSTSSAYIVSIQPGEKQAYYYTIDTNDEQISRIEYKVKAKETVSPDNKRAKSSDFEFIGTNERIDEEYGDSSITGTIKNNSKQDVEFLELTVVFKKDGNVVGGYTTYADDLEAGDETSFEINAYNAPEHDAYELYAVNQDYN